MILVSGIDLVDIKRFEEVLNKYGDRFTQRVFTNQEVIQAGKNAASLAARFAAKEAAAKALGTGIGKVSWQDIEILRNEARQPHLFLHGNAALLGETLGIDIWSISLSHTINHAIAMVIGIGD